MAADSSNPIQGLVQSLRADARTKLLDLLDEVSGRKALMLDNTIVGPLDLIVSPSDLKDHGVQNWFKLSEQAAITDCSQIIFLIRCTRPELVDWVATQILADEAAGKDRAYAVVFIPRKTDQCVERLDASSVRANVRIVECAIHFFPFDRDVLSMETPGVFSDLHVQGNPSSAFYTATALMFLQSKVGTIKHVNTIGPAAKMVLDVMLRLQTEENVCDSAKDIKLPRESAQPGVPPVVSVRSSRNAESLGSPAAASSSTAQPSRTDVQGIEEVIIIDRKVDLFSVLCSQFTYQALVDAIFGINNSMVDLSSAAWAREKNREQVRLSSDDPFFREIRDLHIDQLGPLLQERAQEIQQTYQEKDNIKHPTEMAEYIQKFKTAQSAHPLLELHINLAHALRDAIQTDDYRQHLTLEDNITAPSSQSPLEAIEDWIDDQRPVHEVMRLLCLYSLVNNGVKAKYLDQVKNNILQSYGFEHFFTLCNMEKVGLLRYQQGKSLWSSIKRQFNLFPDDDVATQDVSYAYSGYAPLSTRLVQMASRKNNKGWKHARDALSLLPSPAEEVVQSTGANVISMGGPVENSHGQSFRPVVSLVVFVGGLTYGELATLRRLSEVEDGNRRFLILTTEMLNAKKLFESMRDEQAFRQPPLEATKAKTSSETKKTGFGFWPGR